MGVIMYQYPKQILTIPQQIQAYKDAGMIISSDKDVESALKNVGYYRLRGYSFHLYDNANKSYMAGTKFEDIMNLYDFDQELSHMIFAMISKIEVALRTRLVDALLIHGDALIFKDSSIFVEKDKYWSNLATVSSEIARSGDVFIRHNFKKHEGEIPVWAMVEVISFGTLSKIIKNLKHGPGSSYAALADNYKYISPKGKSVLPSQKRFSSWVKAVSILRNMCAHNSRIYNRTIHTTPELIDTDKINPQPAHNGLYQILLAMKYLRPDDNVWNDFIRALEQLIISNSNIVNIAAMNFPQNWKSHLIV